MATYNYNLDPDDVTPFGDGGHVGENEGMIGRLLLVAKGQNIDTIANAILAATYKTDIKQTDGRMYVTAPVVRQENLKGTAEPFEFPNGRKKPISFSKYGYRLHFDISDATMIALFSMNNREFDAYIVTVNGYIKGRKDSSEIIFWPKRVSDFLVEGNYDDSDGKVKYTSAVVNFSHNADFEENSVYVKPTAFDPMNLEGVRQVDLSGADGSVTKHGDFTIKDKSGFGIEGLVAADFAITGLTVDGAITENGDGVYDITFTETGTITIATLDPAADISIDDYIEIHKYIATGQTVESLAIT